jgi:hypothetical protein
MFKRALEHEELVLIRLTSVPDCFEYEICTSAAGLLGAIHLQYNLDFDDAGRNRALQIALANKQRLFTFRNKRAFDTIKPEYTCPQLAEVRRALGKSSRSELKRQLNVSGSRLHSLYMLPSRFVFRDAVAHALLERGIAVGLDDLTAKLAPSY